MIHGRLYVVDAKLSRISVFGLDGTFVGKWGTKGSKPSPVPPALRHHPRRRRQHLHRRREQRPGARRTPSVPQAAFGPHREADGHDRLAAEQGGGPRADALRDRYGGRQRLRLGKVEFAVQNPVTGKWWNATLALSAEHPACSGSPRSPGFGGDLGHVPVPVQRGSNRGRRLHGPGPARWTPAISVLLLGHQVRPFHVTLTELRSPSRSGTFPRVAAAVVAVATSPTALAVGSGARRHLHGTQFRASIGARGEAGVYAWGMAYNPRNEILVGDYWNYKIRRYDLRATSRRLLPVPGAYKGQPYSISVDSATATSTSRRSPTQGGRLGRAGATCTATTFRFPEPRPLHGVALGRR